MCVLVMCSFLPTTEEALLAATRAQYVVGGGGVRQSVLDGVQTSGGGSEWFIGMSKSTR